MCGSPTSKVEISLSVDAYIGAFDEGKPDSDSAGGILHVTRICCAHATSLQSNLLPDIACPFDDIGPVHDGDGLLGW